MYQGPILAPPHLRHIAFHCEVTLKTEIIDIDWSWDHPIIQELLLKYYRDWLFNTPEIALAMVERILSITAVQRPGRVLDIGCGTGYHAEAFAQIGFGVYAFDPGDRYLDIARRRISEKNLDVSIRQMTCSELSESETFSLAWAGWYCPGQLSPSDVARDFSRIYHALLPGGWFVSTVAGKPKIPPFGKVRNWKELSDCYALSEKWADEIFFYEDCSFVYPETNKVIKFIEVERMYGVQEICPLLEEVGFTEITTAINLKNDGPAQEGKHFAFWCRKPSA